ncbi:MAG: hypothetical protein H6738_02850 [Alphaproteobacteria bacterium]|nr:hypothetical protein [Alphaproteobacteria bacterium]MCB9695709.1 hypothetical protein [Alphaproteobacteria bacterium]
MPGDVTGFTAELGRQVVEAARSRHPDANRWGAVARPIRDPLRKQQRDALVHHLLATDTTGELWTADDLYQRLLIDVSMNPEMLTSRVVQASATVQLFVHRCLFGLEPDVDFLDDEDRREWEWMRTFRVWEAARKVFLYPENWIEPELRSDKTPFFAALETELAQGDTTDDRVEEVTLAYLDQLHAVASLEIMACHHQLERDADGVIDRFHVFARTRATPATWWYRRREDGAVWTPWTEIRVGLTGDHLIPVVHDRRLMLFWAELVEQQAEQEGAQPSSWWEIALSWTEHRDGIWSARRQGSRRLALNVRWMDDDGLEKRSPPWYGFVSRITDDGELRIRAIAAKDTSAIAYWSRFFELGTFVLNPCTMDLDIERNDSETEITRIALDPTRWQAPAFVDGVLDLTDDDFAAIQELDVYAGEVSDAGYARAGATAIDVLDRITPLRAVVPSQWNDFVSQSPFFVSSGERVWFVEPTLEPGLSRVVAEADPPLAGLQTYTHGTFAAVADVTPIEQPRERARAVRLEETGIVVTPDTAFEPVELDGRPGALLGHLATYRFSTFHHPYVCRFLSEVRRSGVFGLLDPDPDGVAGDLFRQALHGAPDAFDLRYQPTEAVVLPRPVDTIDFDADGAYAPYNWELFFHLPVYVATRLADAGR